MAEGNDFYPGKKSIFGLFSITSILIAINVFAFVLFTLLVSFNVTSISSVALKPSAILQGKYLWTFLTSMFMHGGVAHLFFNMISLFFIGTFVERIIGRKRYVWFYLLSGLIAGLFFVFLAYLFGNSTLGAQIFGNPSEYGVGASGAIFGLAGLLAVLVPYKKVYLIAGPLIAIILQSVFQNIYPSSAFSGIINSLLTLYIFISIFTMFSFNPRTRAISVPIEMPFWILPLVAIVPLVVVGLFVSLPIANTAHFGGLVAGLLYGFYLRKKYSKKTKYISRYFR